MTSFAVAGERLGRLMAWDIAQLVRSPRRLDKFGRHAVEPDRMRFRIMGGRYIPRMATNQATC
jgi:hypothetical protein